MNDAPVPDKVYSSYEEYRKHFFGETADVVQEDENDPFEIGADLAQRALNKAKSALEKEDKSAEE